MIEPKCILRQNSLPCCRHSVSLTWVHITLLIGSLMLQKADNSRWCRFTLREAIWTADVTALRTRPPSLSFCDSGNVGVARIASHSKNHGSSLQLGLTFESLCVYYSSEFLLVVPAHVAKSRHGICDTSCTTCTNNFEPLPIDPARL